MALAFTRPEWNDATDHVFLDRPNILTRHTSLASTGNGIALGNVIDIVANEVAVDLTARDAFAIHLQQGVRDTNNEALLFGGSTVGNTGDAFADSHEWLTIRPGQRAALDAVSLSSDTRRRIIQDLNRAVATGSARPPIDRAAVE